MKKRNLTYSAAWRLSGLVQVERRDLFRNIMRRVYYNLISWEPYGGLPEDGTAIFLDPRWEGDRELIALCEEYEIGTPED